MVSGVFEVQCFQKKSQTEGAKNVLEERINKGPMGCKFGNCRIMSSFNKGEIEKQDTVDLIWLHG